ncbi:MAG: FKBP-type peptidyl-prolyl cis-trans isomerase N-terminal domain-containing protein [Phycisphaerae bacterium]|nr:FKBP-type peptidyl-prolyl cis-trans isomerase N-terminal domain-containing protein [Phycisphaerae bacterium]
MLGASFLGTTLVVALAGCANQSSNSSRGVNTSDAAVSANDATRFAYGVGYSLGGDVKEGLAADGLSADADLVLRGFNDGLQGLPPGMPKPELDRVLRAVHRALLDRAAQKQYAEDPQFRQFADANAARSAKSIAEFAAQLGTRRIEDGVYAITVATGSGPQPGASDVYIADWTLALIGENGAQNVVDDRKASRVDPEAILPLASRVLRLMRVGDHWKVAIAPAQAFGIGGDVPAIGPNESLFLDITVTASAKREDH